MSQDLSESGAMGDATAATARKGEAYADLWRARLLSNFCRTSKGLLRRQGAPLRELMNAAADDGQGIGGSY
jgi:hypothetical protein